MAVGYTTLKDFKGLNLTDAPVKLEDDELAWARNCFPSAPGFIAPRQVQKPTENQFNVGNGLFDISTKVTWIPWDSGANDAAFEGGLYQFVDSNGKHRVLTWIPFEWPNGAGGLGPVRYDPMGAFLHTAQSGLYFPNSDATVVWRPGASASSTVGRYFPRLPGFSRRPISLVHNNELYLFLGHSYPGLILGANDFKADNLPPFFRELGAGWTVGAGVSGDHPKFAFGDVYKGVFVMGGLPPPYESLLAFTAPGSTPGVLLETAKWLGVGFGDGDKLLRVMSTPILGGNDAVEAYMLALKQRSVWLVQGVTPSSTDTGSLRVTPLLKREGLIAPHAVCHTPNGIAWCSGRNVWLMPPGTEPKPIGDKIKGFLSKLPQTPSDAWYMEYHDDVLYLNFPWMNGLVKGYEYGQANSAASERTYLASGQLWCDLRNPDEPKWWGPQDVRASHMLSLDIPDGAKQLAGVTPYWSNPTGAPVYSVQPFMMADSAEKGLDLADPGTMEGFSLGDSIPCSGIQVIRPRELDFGDAFLEKLIEAVEVDLTWNVALGSQATPAPASDTPVLTVLFANDGRKLELGIGPIAPSPADFSLTSKSQTGFVLDKDNLTLGSDPTLEARLSQTFIPVVFFPRFGTRFLARTVQSLFLALQTGAVDPIASSDDYMTRKITIRGITYRIRPIGRRPGGSYGG